MPSRPRTNSSSSWDRAPSANKAISAKGTQKPSRVRRQLLQRARRFLALVSLWVQRVNIVLWRLLCAVCVDARKGYLEFFCYYSNKACQFEKKKSTKCFSESPVINERISDGLAGEFTVLLQGVECVLDRLVNSFLDGATHLLNLVHTATWLRTGTQDKNMELYTKGTG